MVRKQLVTGILGILIGFILGFFLAQYLERSRSVEQPGKMEAEGENPSLFPEGHPPPEILEKLGVLQERARADPQDREIRIMLGNLYYDMGRFDAAITWYEEALGLDPTDVNVQTDLGTAHLYTGDAARAIQLYRSSLKAQPDHPQSLQNLGFAYLSTEKWEEAIQVWQKLIDTHPEYPHVEEIKKQMQNARAQLREESS